jgi:hypothetical protein
MRARSAERFLPEISCFSVLDLSWEGEGDFSLHAVRRFVTWFVQAPLCDQTVPWGKVYEASDSRRISML